MNPILRAALLVMLMRAAEHLVDYINARLRSAGGFMYELWILAPARTLCDNRKAGHCDPNRAQAPAEMSAVAKCDGWHPFPECGDHECWLRRPPPVSIAPDAYPSHVTLGSEASAEDVIEVCGVLFEIDTIIRAEGRCDRLVLAPVSIDMAPLGCAPRQGRVAGALSWLRGFFRGFVEAIGGRR